jgi:hypothetical protein
LRTAKIWYRCHPFYGVEIEVVRYLRRTESEVLIVRLPAGSLIAVPDWMLNSQVCERFTNEAEPRISIDALFDLRRLIDAHRVGKTPAARSCAESPSGGKDAQERKTTRGAAQAALRRGRNLDRASGTSEGAVPGSVAPDARKHSQDRQREAG